MSTGKGYGWLKLKMSKLSNFENSPIKKIVENLIKKGNCKSSKFKHLKMEGGGASHSLSSISLVHNIKV